MNEHVKLLIEDVKKLWLKLDINQKFSIAALLVAMFVVGIFFIVKATEPNWTVLYSDLSKEDVAAITESFKNNSNETSSNSSTENSNTDTDEIIYTQVPHIYRLNYIADTYENSIVINYEKNTNKIESIVDSQDNIITFEYKSIKEKMSYIGPFFLG